MAKRKNIDSGLKKKIASFSLLLEKAGIKPDRIILYGSWAKGTAKDYSDVDLCIVSPSFARKPDFYFKKIWHLATKIDSSLEPITFTPSELNNKYSTLAEEIRKYGLQVS